MSLEQILPSLFDNYFIKIIFLVHALLVFIIDFMIKSDASVFIYTAYNLLFLICVLLAIVADRNVDIILVATVFGGVCILLDLVMIFTVSVYGFWTISFVLLHVLLRCLSAILLLKNYSARAGVSDPTSGLLEVHIPVNVSGQARTSYHNIDQPSQNLP